MSLQGCTPSSASATSLTKSRSIGADILNCFRSVHLAIVLLSLLAIGTIIGVVMPQEGMVELADIEKKFGANFEFFKTLGFFNVYSSFWFITLEVLFFFNLLIGSFKWLKPATLAAVQKTYLSPELMLHKPEVHSLAALSTEGREALETKMTMVLKRFRYRVHRDGQGNLYACKGNITRLGPCVAHFGILLCLIAALYGTFTGFKAVRMAVPGDTFSIMESNTFKTNMPQPVWLGHVPEWRIHVKDFRVEYYPERPDMAKQYYSDLQLLSPEGKVLKEETIYVNHPLIYEDISIYQASFAPTGRFLVEVNEKPLAVEINNQFNDRPISVTQLHDGNTLIMFPFFAGQDPGVTKNYAVFFVRHPGESFTGGRMPENLRLEEGKTGSLKGQTIRYQKPEMSTGLQMKRAPEVPLMYLSYLIIMLGTALCFFSQRQIWVALQDVGSGKTGVLFHSKTNKARLAFRKELIALQAALNSVISNPKPSKEM